MHHPTDVQKAWRHIPVLRVASIVDSLPYECNLVAVEICDSARPLPSFVHPERACYVFGPEDGSVPERIVGKAQAVVSIPSRFCLNLAACVNVVLYDRMAQKGRL